jgi:hypothetical protein
MSLPFRIYAVRLTSIACRFCAPSPARSLCERIRFGGLLRLVGHGVPHNVVLLILCASLRSRSCSHAFIAVSDLAARPASAKTRSQSHCRRQPRTTGVLLVEFDLAAAGQDLEFAAHRPAVAAAELADRRSAVAATPPPMAPALQSPSRPGCDGSLIDETTSPGIRYTRDEALPRRS